MVDFLLDRVCETSTTTGTGNLTLAGAVAGFQTFDDAGASSSNEVPYLIEAVDADGVPTGDWEAGIGLLSAPTTLQRIAVTSSSNTGSLVSFAAGTKRVHLAAIAASLNRVGGVYRPTSNITSQDFTTATAIPWDTKNWDNEPTGFGLHDPVTNNSRILLPDGYDPCLVRLSGQVALANITVADYVELSIRINGGSTPMARTTNYVATTTPAFQVTSKIDYSGTANYFELFLKVGADNSVDIVANQSWFQIEVLQ